MNTVELVKLMGSSKKTLTQFLSINILESVKLIIFKVSLISFKSINLSKNSFSKFNELNINDQICSEPINVSENS